MPVNRVGKRVSRDVSLIKLFGKSSALVENAAAGYMPAFESLVGNMVEIAEGIRVLQFAVLAEAFDIVGALHLVEANDVAKVGAGDGVAVGIEVESPGVASSLGEQLELSGKRMITPDALLESDPADMGRDRAPLGTIEPAIRPPLQGVGKGVCVLHAKAAQEHFRVAVGNIIAVAIGVEEEVRRLGHEDTAVAERHTRRQVQPSDEILDCVEAAVAARVL